MKTEVWITLAVLSVNSIQDLRKREILLFPTAAAGAAGIYWQMLEVHRQVPILFCDMLPGLLLICLSRATRGKLGAGDGLLVWTVGIWLGFFEILGILVWGFLLAGGAAILIVILKSGKREIPFIPFLLAAFLAERMFR